MYHVELRFAEAASFAGAVSVSVLRSQFRGSRAERSAIMRGQSRDRARPGAAITYQRREIKYRYADKRRAQKKRARERDLYPCAPRRVDRTCIIAPCGNVRSFVRSRISHSTCLLVGKPVGAILNCFMNKILFYDTKFNLESDRVRHARALIFRVLRIYKLLISPICIGRYAFSKT